MNQIRPNIYLGDSYDAKSLPSLKSPVTAILNVASEISNERHRGIISVKCGMKDTAEDAYQYTKSACEALEDLLSKGHVVLVHCKQGKSRSPHIVASYLSHHENRSYSDVYDEVRVFRPQIMAYSIGQEIQEKFG